MTQPTPSAPRRARLLVSTTALLATALLAACSSAAPSDSDAPEGARDADTHADAQPDPTAEHDDGTDHDEHEHSGEEGDSNATEVAAQTPRLVLTYDGGLLVLDAATLSPVADIPLAGFNRLSSAGDGRHVLVATAGGWATLDVGTWSSAHGDHRHYFTADPQLHEVILEAQTPGHVVVHDDLTSFFDDGTGRVTVVETSEWTDMVAHEHLHPIREYTTAAAHHGVAVATQEGNLVVTRGDESARSGAMLLDADGAEIVSSDECPGVHGAAAFEDAAGQTLFALGCEDGVLVLHEDQDHVHKLTAPDAYGRSGNLFASAGSDVVLGDYKSDPADTLSQVAIIDTGAETITPVDPFDGSGANYTFRGLARGDDGELLVLGTDGTVRVLDEAGALVTTIQVTEPWAVPEEWQSPQPTLQVVGGMAYVSEPATQSVHIVDYVGGEVWKSVAVGRTMNEVLAVTG